MQGLEVRLESEVSFHQDQEPRAQNRKMKLTILLECVALVVSVHGVTFRVPLISVGQDDSPSVSRPRLAATIEVGETRTRQQNQSPEQAVPRYRKGRLARSGAIGDVENDAEYMDFIKSSSTLQPLPIDSEVSRRALPLWVSHLLC